MLRRSGRDYRYGYQGMYAEEDKETGKNSFELRMYDNIIGRWLSVDPKRQYPSPYVGMNNEWVKTVDSDGGQGESTHTNKDGRVIAVYNDGDLGVYRHQNASTKSDVDALRSRFGNSGGGEWMGRTLHMFSFVDFDQFEKSTKGHLVLVPSGRIDFQSDWAANEVVAGAISVEVVAKATGYNSFGIYMANAFNGRRFDLKSQSPEGIYYGSILYNESDSRNTPIYASARDAGNVLAGIVANGQPRWSHSFIFNGFGALNMAPKSWSGIGKMFGAAGIYLASLSSMNVLGDNRGFILRKPSFGEDTLSAVGIIWGFSNKPLFVR